MVDRIEFKNYKAFKGSHTLEIRPITLLVGKNSSGKTSLCKLFQIISSLITNDGENLISIETFNQHRTTDFDISVHNTEGQKLSLSFYVNNGDSYVKSVIFDNRGRISGKDFIRGNVQKTSSLSLSSVLNDSDYCASNFDTSSCYIGPVRLAQTLVTYTQEGRTRVGVNGTDAYQILIESYRNNSSLVGSVSQWFKENLEGQELSLREIPGTFENLYTILINHNGVDIPISNVGQGVTQVLPIIVQSFILTPEPFVIIEEPELHLHPAAHACVAERLAQSAVELGYRYVIESHSENFLLGLRKMVVNPASSLNAQDVIVYFVKTDEKGSYLEKITIDDNGNLSSWPTGVFSESFDLMTEIMSYRQ